MDNSNVPHKLRVVIFEGSFQTTPFINRMVAGLTENHTIYILGFNESIDVSIKDVNYVSLGSNQKKIGFIKTALAFSIGKKSFTHFLITLKRLFNKRKKDIQQQNFEIAVSQIAPDIIHVQWPSLLPWCEPFLLNNKYKIILSQRGSQTNIVPFVDVENFEYLKNWYSKIAGFHSVSKAISNKGDIIWNNDTKIDRVIYTGLQLENFKFVNEYSKTNTIKLLSVGRGHWVKGYNYALKCCKILKATGVSFNYTIIGGADNEELLYLRNEYDLNDLVHLKERMSQDQVFELMSSSSLLLMPSIAEGIPNVVVESMALGIPVISADCGGISELIKNDCEGWIVPSRDSKKMASVIESFINTPLDKINRVRMSARKKIEKQHSEELMVEKLNELYKEVIQAKK